MFLLSVFFPLLGGLINVSPVARLIGHRGSTIVAITCMVVAFTSSVVVYYEVVFMGCAVSVDVFGTWFSVGSFNAGWNFNFDILTANMLFTVTGVSMAVHLYACDYMRQDPHLNLFLGYLSFFTGFMCVLVAADNLLVMLVGWEGNYTLCPNGSIYESWVIFFTRNFYTARLDSSRRHGLHSFLFKQLLTGFMLGDGWLEKHGKGARMRISLIEKYRDVAAFYQVLLYGMGYTDKLELKAPLVRKKGQPYFQIGTFSFESLLSFFDMWYKRVETRNIKVLPQPQHLYELLTPFALAVWIMGDGCGMKHGSFKLCSHSFTEVENKLLCQILLERYGIKTSIHFDNELCYIYVWKRSVPLLYSIVKPYLLESCKNKFRFVNM
jgi:hypothetical protein